MARSLSTCVGACNLISGNGSSGISVTRTETTNPPENNRILGNFIGTDFSGIAALGNGEYGIHVYASVDLEIGDATGGGNLISGNGQSGIDFDTSGGSVANMTVLGNRIGTDRLGLSPVPNLGSGITIGGLMAGGDGATIGGGAGVGGGTACEAECNLISGNMQAGIMMRSSGGAFVIEGNFIGTDLAGTGALGNDGSGIDTSMDFGGVTILRNLISGNGAHGALAEGNGPDFYGNIIGADKSGWLPIGNGGDGIHFENGVLGETGNPTLVGGFNASDGNIVAFNGGNGISLNVEGTERNHVLSNSIYNNTGIGIDLGNDGATSNDSSDVDEGPRTSTGCRTSQKSTM